MHHPWRRLRELVDWTLHFAHLPEGILGRTDYDHRTVTIAHGLTQAERRSTIAHELEHIHRGPVPEHYWPREELQVDNNAARQLIDIRDLGEALAWAHDEHEAADELWVDVPTLRARLRHLHPSERHYLRRRLSKVE